MTARNLKALREQYYHLTRIKNFKIMARTYLRPVQAQIVTDFVSDHQFCGTRYSLEQGWSQELARFHLRKSLAKLDDISKQRITLREMEGA